MEAMTRAPAAVSAERIEEIRATERIYRQSIADQIAIQADTGYTDESRELAADRQRGEEYTADMLRDLLTALDAATTEAARLRKAAGDALAWLDALTNPSTHIVALAEGLRAALAPTPAPEGPSEDASSEAYAALRALRDYFAARDGDEAMAAYDAAAVALTNLAGRGRA